MGQSLIIGKCFRKNPYIEDFAFQNILIRRRFKRGGGGKFTSKTLARGFGPLRLSLATAK